MIKAIIIDDEPDGLEDLRESLIKYCPEVQLAGAYTSPVAALGAVKDFPPDVVFLDVQMPGMSGFEFLQKLSPVSFHVVFVSAYDRYAIKAIKFSALDYLLKPIDVDDLIRTVSRIKERMPDNRSVQSVLHHTQRRDGRIERVAIPGTDGIDLFNTQEIIYCEADSSYTKIHLTNGQTKTVTRVLKDFEELLSESGFCRVHHSFLVNLAHVKRYVKGEGGYAILTGDHHVDISRRKKEEFLSQLNQP